MANSAMPAAPTAITPAQQLNARFTTIYTQFQPSITRLVQRQVRGGNIHLAEDLTADAFYRAWLDLHNCQAETDGQMYNWLATLARRTVGQYYRTKKNTAEVPADTGSWQFANRQMDTSAGYFTPAATGFRTARITTRPGDSDPDPDEALRRVRATPKRAATAGALPSVGFPTVAPVRSAHGPQEDPCGMCGNWSCTCTPWPGASAAATQCPAVAR